MKRMTRFFHIDTLWMAIPLVATLVVTNLLQVLPNDFWWHLRTGQIIISEGYIPTTDLFSFTSFGEPWINQAWLMQIFYYTAYTTGGLALIIFSHALMVTLGYAALLFVTSRFYGVRIGVIAAVVGITLGLMNWSIRPQGISIAAFGILMALILAHRNGRTRWIWGTVPLFIIWVNGHGGFVFGLATLGLYVAGQLWTFWRAGKPATQKKMVLELTLVGLIALGAISFNPQGPLGITQYVISFVRTDSVISSISEFGPMTIKTPDGVIFLLVVILTGILFTRSGLKIAADQWLILGVFFLLALFARRNLIWFGFVIAPILAAGLAELKILPPTNYPGIAGLNALLLGLFALLILLALPWFRSSLPLPEERKQLASPVTPFSATDFLCKNAPDKSRVFQDQVFGGYQVWGCPQLPVFIDTRIINLYPDELWQDYFAIARARYDWEKIAQDYALTHLFLRKDAQESAITALSESPKWVQVYQDEIAVIFQQVNP